MVSLWELNHYTTSKLWDKMKYIVPKKTNDILPDSSCNTKLASSFNDFFISKIAKIRDTSMLAKSDSNIHPETFIQLSQILYSLSHKSQKVTCQSLFGHHPANHVTLIHVQLKSSRTALIFWQGQSQ